MLDLDALGATAMEIIAYAGVAKSNYVLAMKMAKKHEFIEAQEKLLEGDSILKQAHDLHLGLLQKEAVENEAQVSMLVLHAEDQFMSCETIKLMVEEFIDIYKKEGKK